VRVAEAQKRAYVRSIASGVQQEFSEYFEWILDYEETSSVTAPIRVVNQSNEQSTGLYLRKDSTLAQRLFGRDTVWWQSADNDFSQLKMFSELLRKDSKPDEVQEHARIMSDLATHFTNVHARMSEVIAEASQTSEKSFFEQVFEKVKYKSDYGIRDIQQNIADYIEALLHADVFEFNGSTVVESPTDLDSYFKELADKVTHQLDTSIQKMTRRRQSI
jgi:hypothetical protein